MAEIPSLGEFELQVLRLVWQEQPCTERQLTDLIQAARRAARTTVLKTIQRLESKGLLVRVPGEGAIRYRAAIERQHVLPELIRRFVDQALGGSAEPLAAYLADADGGRLSSKDLAALRSIARKIGGEPNSAAKGET
jgi:BlaI family penicillinase repressor